MNSVVATQTLTESKQEQSADNRIKQLRDLFADAPECTGKAVEEFLDKVG